MRRFVLAATIAVFSTRQTNGFGWSDVTDTVKDGWEEVTDATENLVDTVVPEDVQTALLNEVLDIAEDFGDSLAGVSNTIGTALTGATTSVTGFLSSLDDEDAQIIAAAVRTVPYLEASTIVSAAEGYIDDTWDDIQDAGKYVIKTLPEAGQELLNKGLQYLEDLIDIEFAPFPLSVIEREDVVDVAKCVGTELLDFIKEWAEDVGTSFVAEADLEISSLVNTEIVEDLLEESLLCIQKQAKEIWERESEELIDSAVQAAYDWMKFEDDFVLAVEIQFSACTLACGTVGLGLAASAVDVGKVGIYRTITTGIDLSASVGAAFTSSLVFYPSYEGIAGKGHSVGFDLELPIIPDFIPAVGLGIATDGSFGGMAITSDALDLQFELIGVFGLSYGFSDTEFIITSKDLREKWSVPDDEEVETDEDKAVVRSYSTFSKTVNSGTFIKEKRVHAGVSGVSDEDMYMTLSCPADEDTTSNREGSINLGYIDLQSVYYGNRESRCNGTDAFSIVWDTCAYASECNLQLLYANLTKTGRMEAPCTDSGEITLEVAYNCAGSKSAYDLSCFGARFKDIIERRLYQDYEHDILMDDWEERNNVVGKCAAVSDQLRLPMFASYNHGMCISFKKMEKDGQYNKYNITYKDTSNLGSECPTDGLGDVDDWNVYAFVRKDLAFEDMGCMPLENLTDIWRKLKNMEGRHYLSQDDYKTRKLAINKCAQMAADEDVKGFALTDGGSCYVSNLLAKSRLLRKGIDVNKSEECYEGAGDEYRASLYQFPHYQSSKEDDGSLTDAELAMAITIPIIFVILVVVVLLVTNYFGLWTQKGAQAGCVDCCAIIGEIFTDCYTETSHCFKTVCCKKRGRTGRTLELDGQGGFKVKG